MVKKSLFLRFVGDSPRLRVMDFLVVSAGLDYPMREIAEKSGIGYSTLKLFWNNLVRDSVVTQTRRIGNAKLFRLNTENPAVKKFGRMYWEVTKAITSQLRHKRKEKSLVKEVKAY